MEGDKSFSESDDGFSHYDFGARIYDARLGRWLSGDPLESNYPDLSPYNFVANSPLIFVEVDGEYFDLSGIKDEKVKLKVEHALKILAKTHPNIYNNLDKSEIAVSFSLKKLNTPEVYEEGYSGRQEKGLTSVSLESKKVGLTYENNSYMSPTTLEEQDAQWEKEGKVDARKKISESKANSLVDIVDNKILIELDIKTIESTKKDYSEVVGHEAAHAEYYLKHKAESLLKCNTDDAHSTGNPNGEYANRVGNEIKEKYKDANNKVKADKKAGN